LDKIGRRKTRLHSDGADRAYYIMPDLTALQRPLNSNSLTVPFPSYDFQR